jgi:hypothetical protein
MRGEGMERIERLAREALEPFPAREFQSPRDAREAIGAIRADREPELARFVLAVMPVVKAAETFKRCPSSANCGGLFDAIDAFTATEAGGENK